MAWKRYVALGDSFTEGVGDPDETRPHGVRGWADRVAENLGRDNPDFKYANLAIRGKLIQQIRDEQVGAALELAPDLVTLSGGANDLLRPKSNPDMVAEIFEEAVEMLNSLDTTVCIFTGLDVGFNPLFRAIRGKIAIYNEHLHWIAKKHNLVVVQQWGLSQLKDARMWAPDRLHLSSLGHEVVAQEVLKELGVPYSLHSEIPEAISIPHWSQARKADLLWAKEHLLPWVLRRIKHESSGDSLEAKIPEPQPPLKQTQ